MSLSKRIAREVDREKDKNPDWLERVDVDDFLSRLKLENVAPPSYKGDIQFSCPFSGHSNADDNPSAFMNNGSLDKSKTTKWQCFGCKRKGNAITFLAEFENISKTEARETLRSEYAPDFRSPKGGSIRAEFEERQQKKSQPKKKKKASKIDWGTYNEMFGVDWPLGAGAKDFEGTPAAYMYERGFVSQTLNDWKIGYDEISDRITIPICNAHGELVGVKGRAWRANRKPRYIALGDTKRTKRARYGFTPYEKSAVVFGVNKAVDSEVAILDEGELNCLAWYQIGHHAVSTGSAAMSREQELILRNYYDEVIVCFDYTDEAGLKEIFGYEDNYGNWNPGVVERLERHLHVRVVPDHEHDASKLVELGRTDDLEQMIKAACNSNSVLLESHQLNSKSANSRKERKQIAKGN